MKTSRQIQDLHAVIEEIDSFLTKYNMVSRDVVCCRLLMEEVILAYRDKGGCERGHHCPQPFKKVIQPQQLGV